MSKEIINVDDVWKTYTVGTTKVHALQGLSLAIKQGDFAAVMGPSGSGKSTAMHIIGTLLFTFIVGSISGILPAYQASRVPPVEALRYE